ncbi:nuclear transport factor 2 family protein [Nocardioides carbamazepini]|uniref:nuclear transport factor 2 family protein n=1 Tax=Nocardioides carbamazepini TaxID=2854259 RepID=UPI00214A3C38|nr:nuclear transport factor 2 family protein [Nocardioides carbamazepini]MCR1783402.1 nuclear transport factor 2 family protein [Nocardioides carbamazepini]
MPEPLAADRGSLAPALRLMAALDANDAEGVRRCFAPDGTWWVDTGLDRAAGVLDVDPGDDRPWPLHGLMPAQAKCDLLRSVPERFPGGVRQHVRRSFAGGEVAVLEVEGDGLFLGERPYRNRYAFVLTVRDGAVTSLREYLDTAHSAAVFDGRGLDRRSLAPEPAVDVIADVLAEGSAGPGERLAADFLDALEAADGDRLLALCTPTATWWADGGRTRTAGPEAPADPDAALVVVGRVPVTVRAPRIGGLRTTFPDGLRLRAHRVVTDDDFDRTGLVAVEVQGHGVHRRGGTYQNRYVFVLRAEDGRLAEIREYCDTRHAFDVYGIDR